MYPVHRDRARGVLESLTVLGIEYPVADFQAAWQRLLQAYLAALEDLRAMVGELVERKAPRSN